MKKLLELLANELNFLLDSFTGHGFKITDSWCLQGEGDAVITLQSESLELTLAQQKGQFFVDFISLDFPGESFSLGVFMEMARKTPQKVVFEQDEFPDLLQSHFEMIKQALSPEEIEATMKLRDAMIKRTMDQLSL